MVIMQDYLAWRSRPYAINELADCSSGMFYFKMLFYDFRVLGSLL